MPPEFSGIERRLDELNERLARLRPFQDKSRDDFEQFASFVRVWLSKRLDS